MARLVLHSRKLSLSRNPLSQRNLTPIQALAGEIQTYLHFPDPSPLYILLGSIAANMLHGEPVWLMLIGPPSCGKTELLNAVQGLDRIIPVHSVSGESAFLSATPDKDKRKDSTGGLLRQIGDIGGFVFPDFTEILAQPHDRMRQVFAVLRSAYDGHWDRGVGEGGAHRLCWHGKLCCFAGVTPEIDKLHEINAAFGERWVFYRYRTIGSGFGAALKAMRNTSSDWKEDIQQAVVNMFDCLGLSFNHLQSRRDLSDLEESRITAIASVAVRGRSTVSRDKYTRDVTEPVEPENMNRLCRVLTWLYCGMDLLGISSVDRWHCINRIALDSLPNARRRVLDHFIVNPAIESTTEQISYQVPISQTALRRVLEDMLLTGLLELHKINTVRYWKLQGWVKKNLACAIGQEDANEQPNSNGTGPSTGSGSYSSIA